MNPRWRLPALACLLAMSVTPLALAQPEVPDVDTSKRSVPLSEIYFDTFRPTNRVVPLDQADRELILSLRDAIPPIATPRYQAAAEAGWLRDSDPILGYAVGTEAWAYPLRILNYHEIVNDDLVGEPVLVSFCPLCFSGIVYSRRLGDRVLTFGNTSALYESDMVVLDYQTGSYWWQVAGRAIVGELNEAELTPLPSTTTWGAWRALHPSTLVLSRDTGFNRPYDRDPFAGFDAFINQGRFAFPVSDAAFDGRLQPGTKVLTVKLGGEVRAYPLTDDAPAAVTDVIAEIGVVVFLDGPAQSGAIYRAAIDGQALNFEALSDSVVDLETGSTWDAAGRAVAGELAGAQLEALPSKTSFWYAAVASEPTVTVFGQEP